jgi:hypothetical protein
MTVKKMGELKVQMVRRCENSTKKSLHYGAKKQNKVLKSCGADFSIIIWTKWFWFKLFNIDTLNNLKTCLSKV